MSKRLDPKALFTTNAITREGIADDLNTYRECADGERPLADDDPRLTDEFCGAYAEAIGNIEPTEPDGAEEEAQSDVWHDFLNRLKLEAPDEE